MVSKEKLIALRKQRGMTQTEVAEALDVSAQAVSRWERGEAQPSTDNLIKLSQVYQVELSELLKPDEPRDPEKPDETEPPAQEELRPVEPARKLPLSDILWPVCLLAACAVVCATILIMSARPWERDGQNETEVVPITDLEQKQIEISPEDYIEFDPW